MLYSADGFHYQGIGKSTFDISCKSITWNGDIWVAGGEGTVNTLAYSYDGKTWTGLGKDIFTTKCNSVASNGKTWVAMGEGTTTMATSLDGKTWIPLNQDNNPFNSTGVDIDWNGKQWLAIGSGSANTLAVSNDPLALTWIPLSDGVYGAMNCVKWIQNKWYLGADDGNGNTLAYSSDAQAPTWTYVNHSVLYTSVKSISWNGREFISTGTGGGTIATSTDGINWTGLYSGTSGNDVDWNGREWIMASNGSDSVHTGTSTSTAGNVDGYIMTEASALLTNAYCVGVSRRIGAFIPDNRMYLNAGNAVIVYGPDTYDGSISQDTSITFNLNLPV
jgi:hypothetical protein